jgi:hypothetical protein
VKDKYRSSDCLVILAIKDFVVDIVDVDRVSLMRLLAMAMKNGFPKLDHISFDFLRYQLKFWASDPEKMWSGSATSTNSVRLDQYFYQLYSKLGPRKYEFCRGNGFIGSKNQRYLERFDGIWIGTSSRSMQKVTAKANIKCGINEPQIQACSDVIIEFRKTTPNVLACSINTDGADFGADTLHRNKYSGKITGTIDYDDCLETLEFDDESDKPAEVKDVESELTLSLSYTLPKFMKSEEQRLQWNNPVDGKISRRDKRGFLVRLSARYRYSPSTAAVCQPKVRSFHASNL